MLDNQIAQLSTSSRQPGTLPSQPEKPHDMTNGIHLQGSLTYNGQDIPQDAEEIIIEELDVDAEGKYTDEAAVTPVKSRSTDTFARSTKLADVDIEEIGISRSTGQNSRWTTKSGRSTHLNSRPTIVIDEVDDPSSIATGTSSNADKVSIYDKGRSKAADPPVVIKVPFPGRLKNTKVEQQFIKFLEVVKKSLGTHVIEKDLCNLGASVSVMPYSVCEKLNMGHLKVTNVTLQMAKCTVKRPLGVLEDVPVKIGKFFVPINFIVLDMAEDTQIPIILSRPFLHTTGAIIDVKQGRLTLEVGDDKVTFNLASTLAKPIIEDTCYAVVIVDESMFEYWTGSLIADQLEALIGLDDFAEDVQVEYRTMKAALKGKEFTIEKGETVNIIIKTSYATEVKIPEHKPLPSHLKYVFLDDSEQYPVIVNANLDGNQLSTLLVVLKKYKKALGYSLADLKGINPDICMHRIELEEGHKPCQKGQGKLNSKMQDVVMAEVMKLLDAGIIYTICNFKWVSPVQQCIGVNLVLNWEKCYFMVNEGVVLGLLVSVKGIQVDKEKVQVIEQLPPPINVKGVRSFLGHAGFYCRLKHALITAPIIQPPDWKLSFEIMCDANNFAVGEKFRSYLLGSKVTVFFDHTALRYLFAKKEAKPRLLRWILLLQKFDLEIKDKKGAENLVANHLSRLPLQEGGDSLPTGDSFPDDIFLAICNAETPLYVDYADFIVGDLFPPNLSYQQRKRFLHDVKQYFWVDPYLFKECADGLYRKCIPQWETKDILEVCHSSSYGGHHGPSRTVTKVIQSGFYWPSMFKDAKDFVIACDACQRTGYISRRQ
ncbi:uncharacterized protein LOC141601343 [Silene latifolia]|uniref:uncharacterized protein LOC141601343 n=1 Tax=Silene latifolia TaxID=37657 RepID=UPI003D770925